MGLRGALRTTQASALYESTTVHQLLNAVSRVKSGIMLQHGHRLRSLCNRIYYLWSQHALSTHVPLHAQRLLRFASDLDGDMLTARDHVAVKTAMKKEQVRERERYTRKTRFSPPFTWKKCFRLVAHLGGIGLFTLVAMRLVKPL